MEYVGIDLVKVSSQVCIADAEGTVTMERRIKTTRESFGALFGERENCRIVVEASTESEWVARCLEGLGHEVIVADPNFAPMYAQGTRNRWPSFAQPNPSRGWRVNPVSSCKARVSAGPRVWSFF